MECAMAVIPKAMGHGNLREPYEAANAEAMLQWIMKRERVWEDRGGRREGDSVGKVKRTVSRHSLHSCIAEARSGPMSSLVTLFVTAHHTIRKLAQDKRFTIMLRWYELHVAGVCLNGCEIGRKREWNEKASRTALRCMCCMGLYSNSQGEWVHCESTLSNISLSYSLGVWHEISQHILWLG